MNELLIFNQGYSASRMQREAGSRNGACFIVTTGSVLDVSDATSSGTLTWDAPVAPNIDTGRFFDPGLPAGFFFRQEGFYIVTFNITVNLASPGTGGILAYMKDNNSAIISQWTGTAVDLSTVAFDMVGGAFFAKDGYVNLSFDNFSGAEADFYARAAIFPIG